MLNKTNTLKTNKSIEKLTKKMDHLQKYSPDTLRPQQPQPTNILSTVKTPTEKTINDLFYNTSHHLYNTSQKQFPANNK